MEPSVLRRNFLWSFLGCLGVTALLAIGAILGGGFGELQLRVLATSASVSGASICAMACAAFLERGRAPWLGHAGIGLAGLALVLVVILIWIEPSSIRPWARLTMLATIWAVAVAHAELLLLPRLLPSHRWVQGAAVGAIALLATHLSLIVYDIADDDGMLRLVAAVSIVVALLTLAVPILWKLGKDAEELGPAPRPDRLSLQRGVDGVWVDADGGRYEVRRIDDGGR